MEIGRVIYLPPHDLMEIQVNNFCANCSSAITPNQRFCDKCGSAVSPETSSADAPLPTQSSLFQKAMNPAVANPEATQYPIGYPPLVGLQPGVQVQIINATGPRAETGSSAELSGTYGWPIPSLVIGIFAALSLFDDSKWDSDTIDGAATICITGLTLGIVSLCRQRKGKGMAVAGIVLSSIGLLAVIGRLS